MNPFTLRWLTLQIWEAMAGAWLSAVVPLSEWPFTAEELEKLTALRERVQAERVER